MCSSVLLFALHVYPNFSYIELCSFMFYMYSVASRMFKYVPLCFNVFRNLSNVHVCSLMFYVYSVTSRVFKCVPFCSTYIPYPPKCLSVFLYDSFAGFFFAFTFSNRIFYLCTFVDPDYDCCTVCDIRHIVFFMITLLARSYERVGILLKCEKTLAWRHHFTRKGVLCP